MSATASSRVRPSFSTGTKAAREGGGAAANGDGSRPCAAIGSAEGAAGRASGRSASPLRGERASGTSERRKAPETPKETTVASSASVLRDRADSAPTKRETSKQR